MNKTSQSVLGHAVGRRKSSVARVWLKAGSGNVEVNGKQYTDYFDTDLTKTTVTVPLKICGADRSFDIKALVNGGGMCGQADAIKLGIARALLEANEKFKAVLREHDLLTVDARVKERKKYGQKAARRKFQFVKR